MTNKLKMTAFGIFVATALTGFGTFSRAESAEATLSPADSFEMQVGAQDENAVDSGDKEIDETPPYDNHKPRIACFARNASGDTFRAVGLVGHARRVQNRALLQCEGVSRWCIALGCRKLDN